MSGRPIRLIDTAECEDLYQGSVVISDTLPVTRATWEQLYGEKMPAQPDPWWVDRCVAGATAAQSAAGCQALAWVPPKLDYFRGHFPGAPILPGVVQLQWATTLANHLLPGASFAGLARVKFKAPVHPGAVLRFELQPKPGATKKISLRIASVAGLHTEGQLLYRD
ncbi:MAG: hypothetical protein AB8B93_10510 [Pseudomonadales bacterium]